MGTDSLIRNYGLLQEETLNPKHWLFGGYTGIVDDIIVDDWRKYLPDEEDQKKLIDSMGCFFYDTTVLMEDFSTKRISEIRKGDYVITHKGRKNLVIKTMKREYSGDIYKIKVKGIYDKIVCTEEHPFLTEDGWKKAKDLTDIDRVLIPLTNNLIKDTTINEIEKNEDFLWLLGFYLAEGSLGKETNCNNNNQKLKVNGTGNGSGNIMFSISSTEQEYAKKIQRIGKKLFDTDFHIYNKKNNGGTSVYGYNVFLRNLLDELAGRYSHKKKIDKRLMFIDPKLQLNIVKGWLDGDGCYDKQNRRIIGVSVSEKLIQQMYRILLRNKIKCNIAKRQLQEDRKQAYSILIYGLECNKIINWNLPNLKKESYFQKSRKKIKFKDDCLIQKIEYIEKTKNYNNKKVYNLEIEKDNSYIVNNVAVHNCVSFSANNVLETIFNHRIIEDLIKQEDYIWLQESGYIVNGIVNFSDRYLAKMSGTTKSGNYFHIVGDTVREFGAIPEKMWAFDATFNWEEYYAKIPNELIELGKEFARRFPITYEFVRNCDILEGLKYAPLQVGVYAWPSPVNGVYPSVDKNANHAVQNFESFVIYDTYNPYIKQLEDGYRYGGVVKYHVDFNYKQKPMEIPNNTLVQEVTSSGSFGLVLDNKIIVDDPSLVHLTWVSRNAKIVNGVKVFNGGPIEHLTKEQWASFPKINLKKESLPN